MTNPNVFVVLGYGCTDPDNCCSPNCAVCMAPPPNDIKLSGVTASKLGRFRNGSALAFDGKTSIGVLSNRLNETHERYYFNTTFSLQLVMHLSPSDLAASAGGVYQALVSKPGAWRLGINPAKALEWSVNFGPEVAPEWLNATAPPGLLLPPAGKKSSSGGTRSWVVKATVSRNHGEDELA